MKRALAMFQDNAMFYKDITQWLRNRTFGSLFFGLLLVAEALSLFIIAGSDDMGQPGISMFYILYMVLIAYAVIIAYMGNALTSREFVNRTFELFELSGMSLERMIGGKLLSMLYQFFFGFFCLVPFMFFSYFLGGLDFFEMLVGVGIAGLLALPLYLGSLMMSLMGRFAQVNILSRLFTVFAMGWFLLFTVIAMFSGQPVMRELVQEFTDLGKRLLVADVEAILLVLFFLGAYVQVCLLMFYFCCNSISRETDSREIPIKVLTTTIVLSWMGYIAFQTFNGAAINGSDIFTVIVPMFLAIMALSLISYYNRATIPPIVARRYRDASVLKRFVYWWFQPGMVGGVRTILGLIALVFIMGAGISALVPFYGTTSGSIYSWSDSWYTGASLIAQIPWFLTVPYLLYLKGRDLSTNYTGQRAIMVATWVIAGALVMVYFAWTKTRFFSSNISVSLGEVAIVTLFSPLSSMSSLTSSEFGLVTVAPFLRYASGAVGTVLMLAHLRSVTSQMKLANSSADITPTDVADVKVSAAYPDEDAVPNDEVPATDRENQPREGQ